jgi:hypothetical protein
MSLVGELRAVPFMTTEPMPDGTPMMLQKVYERACGCRLLGGFRLDDETLVRVGRGDDLGAVARDAYHLVVESCDEHAALGLDAVWVAASRASLDEAGDDEAMEVGAKLLDRILDTKEAGR